MITRVACIACLSAANLAAAFVTTYASSNLPPSDLFPIFSSFCAQTADPASCSARAGFSDSTGRRQATAILNASAQFGAASGGLAGGIDRNASIDATYLAYFSDFLTINGPSGTGTLISHFTLASSGRTRFFQVNQPFSPSYRILQGDVTSSPELLIPASDLESSATLSVDVSSSFSFGTAFAFGAGTQLHIQENTDFDSWDSQSSITLTGFTILDQDGRVIDASIVRSNVEGPNVFMPEPGTMLLVLFPIAMIASRRLWLKPKLSDTGR